MASPSSRTFFRFGFCGSVILERWQGEKEGGAIPLLRLEPEPPGRLEQVEGVAKVTKLYVLDVTKVKGPQSDSSGGIAGHGYWYSNPWILSDTLLTFIWQLPPGERGLVTSELVPALLSVDDGERRGGTKLAQYRY